MANFDGYSEILQDLKDRNTWEERQSLWYRLRHSRVGRSVLPYPNAPDMRFPLIDALIERLKAFYFQQLYSTDVLASFVSLKPQQAELTTACATWTDYRLKQQSNFERALLTTIDHMLMSGFCPLKHFWDHKKKQLVHRPIAPVHLIVPKYTIDLSDAPRVVHVLHMSVSDYERNKDYDDDRDFIKLIKGKGSGSGGQSATLEQDKMLREGLTCASNDEEIVLWEVYTRDTSDILVETFSPLQPDSDKKVRKAFKLPYDQGEFKSKDVYPFSLYQMEIKDEGIYSPRGISELLAAFQASLCKMWNQKHEWMDFFNRPTYRQDRDVGAPSNIRQQPGQILPPGLTPNEVPTPPLSFDEEMQSTRALSEYRVNVPDLGATSHFAVRPGYGGEKPTARQIDAIVGQSGIADDMRVRVFRFSLGQSYRIAYSLLLQFDKDSLKYLDVNGSIANLDTKALHSEYLIKPNGSADSWNKGLQLQKAAYRMQTFANNQFVAQDELVKSALELDEVALVQRLFRDPGIQTRDQGFKQSLETLAMLNSFGAPVDEADDDKAHLQSIAQFGQVRMQEHQMISAISAHLISQHIEEHLGGLQKKKDKAFGQFRAMMMPFLFVLQQISASGQPSQPQNVVSMPGAQQQPAPSPQAAAKGYDPQGNAAKLMNGMAALAKAGEPIGIVQLNAVLQQAGIPPIVLAQPMAPVA